MCRMPKNRTKIVDKSNSAAYDSPDETKGDRIMAVAVTISLLALASGVCAHLN